MSIPACHAGDRGSIPRRGDFFERYYEVTHYFEISFFFKKLPDRESNPGLPRDRRGYSPLYYRGLDYSIFRDVLWSPFYVDVEMCIRYDSLGSQQSGAEEACWAHNPEVGGSKPPSAT